MTELTPRSGLETLTQRERECLRLLFGGLRAKEIGAALGVSDATVNNHLASARRKLGTSDSRDAARALFAQERENDVVKEWLDETSTIVAAAAVALHEASREEAKSELASTDRDGVGRRGRIDIPPLVPDQRLVETAGARAVPDDRLSFERSGGPIADADRARAGLRTYDRDLERLESGLPSISGATATARQLSAVQKALWIGGLTIGIATLTGGALPGLMLLIHALQSLATGTAFSVR